MTSQTWLVLALHNLAVRSPCEGASVDDHEGLESLGWIGFALGCLLLLGWVCHARSTGSDLRCVQSVSIEW